MSCAHPGPALEFFTFFLAIYLKQQCLTLWEMAGPWYYSGGLADTSKKESLLKKGPGYLRRSSHFGTAVPTPLIAKQPTVKVAVRPTPGETRRPGLGPLHIKAFIGERISILVIINVSKSMSCVALRCVALRCS
jgi:hypothetical protein